MRGGRDVTPRRTVAHDFEGVILETRGEAENVMAEMDAMLAEYKIVSVADLYDVVGLETKFTDQGYGWNNLDGMRVVRGRDGYSLELPKPRGID